MESIDDRIRVVYVRRDAKEIAESLYRRNKMDREFAKELTQHYHDKLHEHLQPKYDWAKSEGMMTETHYANYFKDWRTELQRVCDFLGLQIPDDTSEIEAFIEPSLRHHKAV